MPYEPFWLSRSAGPFGADAAEGDAVGAGNFDGVAACVFDREILEGDRPGGDQQAFAAGTGLAAAEIEDLFCRDLRPWMVTSATSSESVALRS